MFDILVAPQWLSIHRRSHYLFLKYHPPPIVATTILAHGDQQLMLLLLLPVTINTEFHGC